MALKSHNEEEASLVPSDHSSGGGGVPDGEYDIVKCKTGLFTYPGKEATVPAIIVTYRDVESHDEYEKMYKAGDTDHLLPNADETGFVHPSGGTPKIFGDGAAHYWLQSLDKADVEIKGSKVNQFEGLRVRLTSKLIKLGQEKKDTPIPLIEKVLGQGKATSSKAPAKSTGNSDGDLDAAAVALVLDALKKAPGKTLPLAKLGMNVWMAAGNHADYKDHRQDIKKLITVEWLKAHDQFMTDGEEATLA